MRFCKRLQLGRYDLAAFLTFIAYAAASIAVPVILVEIGHSLDFPLDRGGQSAGGALQIGRGMPMVISMVLCVFLAGFSLKNRMLGFSLLIMAGGISAAALAGNYLWLFAALAAAGIGEGVIEAMATPAVQELHENDEPGRYINFSHGFWSVGIVLAVLGIGGALHFGVNWRYLLLATAALAILPALLFLLPSGEKKFRCHRDRTAREIIGEAVRIVRTPRFWLFFAAMFFAGGGEFAITFWGASYIRLEHNGGAFAGSVATAVFSVGMIAGRLGSAVLVKEKNLGKLVLLFAVAGTLLGILLPCFDRMPLILAAFLLLGVVSGPFWPSVQSYSVTRMKELDSTTIYILLSCAGVPGCAFFTWLMGWIGDRFSLTASLYAVAFCYGVLGLLIGCEIFYAVLRRRSGRETNR